MEINDLSMATRKVVETARESLVIGACSRHVTPENQRHKALKSHRAPAPGQRVGQLAAAGAL
jgi:hypothetical protein